jgi:hypothetical protein
MKKCLALYLTIVITLHAHAQFSNEMLFNMPAPGKLPINIHLRMGNGIKFTLELMNRAQLDSLGNVDSLLHKVWADLSTVKENISKPYVSRRIDYIASRTNAQFRILEHDAAGSTYNYKEGEVVQTKTGQDTLRISMQNFREVVNNRFSVYRPMFITITLANVQDITTIQPAILASGLAMIQRANKTGSGITYNTNLSANYDVATQQWLPLSAGNRQANRKALEPDVYLGIQYVRGAWAPSAAAGLQLIDGNYTGKRNVFKLLWEPHFFFSKDAANALVTDRNDFITFRYYHYDKEPSDDYNYPLNFSVGYLVNRNGNWYEKNTIKFSVPGLQYKVLSLGPEFFFNGLFKNFSPSLKLNFNLD